MSVVVVTPDGQEKVFKSALGFAVDKDSRILEVRDEEGLIAVFNSWSYVTEEVGQ